MGRAVVCLQGSASDADSATGPAGNKLSKKEHRKSSRDGEHLRTTIATGRHLHSTDLPTRRHPPFRTRLVSAHGLLSALPHPSRLHSRPCRCLVDAGHLARRSCA